MPVLFRINNGQLQWGAQSLILPPTTETNLSLRLSFENNITDTSPNVYAGISSSNPVYSSSVVNKGSYSLSQSVATGMVYFTPALTSTLFDGLSSTFTISCYIYPTSLTSSVVYMRHWLAADAYFMLTISYKYFDNTGVSGKIYWVNQNNVGCLTSTTTVSTNTWYKVTIVGNSSGTSMYINNVLEATTTGLTSPTTSNSNANCSFMIGGFTSGYGGTSNYGGTSFYSGYIDDFRIYRLALTPQQIAEF